jgi:AraC-like DNA-binding protein
MPEPLVIPSQIPSLSAALLIVVERTDRETRDTAPHRHPAGQLLGSTRGLLSVKGEQGRWVVPATHAIWLPPHHQHAARSHGPFAGWSIYVAEHACTCLPAEPRTLRMNGLLREAIHRAASWKGARTASQERLAGVILDEMAGLRDEPLGLPLPGDPRLSRITQALADDLADERGLEEWARWAGVPARTLSRRFVTETGFTFTAWRQRARLLRSLELLAEGTPVTTIALELGYANVSAFIALFRRTLGVTPSQYTVSPTGEE